MDQALEDIRAQLSVAKENIDGASSRAAVLGDKVLIENLKKAQEALLKIDMDEKDEERVRNSEYREIVELENIEEAAETLLESLQRDIKKR